MQPISTPEKPKQFLDLPIRESEEAGRGLGYSLLQKAMRRAQAVSNQAPIVVSNQRYRNLLRQQLLSHPADSNSRSGSKYLSISTLNPHPKPKILLEPCKKNTAPAIALAALKALQMSNDPLLLILPSDHLIQDIDGFKQSVEQATALAKKDLIVTFGALAKSASSEFGYIQRGEVIASTAAYQIKRFVEKPSSQSAADYIQSGDFYWNSGIYLINAKHYLKQLKQYQAQVLNACQQAFAKGIKAQEFMLVDDTEFSKSPSISVDYAIMEKTDSAVMVALSCDWMDVGGKVRVKEVTSKRSC